MRFDRIVPAPFAAFGLLVLAGWFHPQPAAAADMTIHGRYQFANGDTATRANYYTDTRMRATAFDGNEVMYDAKTKEMTFLNHTRKRYWRGPISQANAIIDSLTKERDKAFWEAAQAKQQEWMAFTEKFNNSLKSAPLGKERKIAGKKCEGWEVSAGNSLTHSRWVAKEFQVPDFTEQVEKLLLLPALDPVGRAVGRLILQARVNAQGVTLGSSTEMNTPTQKGKFSWEAFRLDAAPIPENVWEIPEGYEEIKF